MVVDEAGVLWLSNPLVTALILTAAVGLVVWCHRWLESGEAPLPRSGALAASGRSARGWLAGRPRDARQPTSEIVRIGRERRAHLRTAQRPGAPRSAA